MHIDFEASMIFCIYLLSILKGNDTYKKQISGPTRLGSTVPVTLTASTTNIWHVL